MPTCNQVERTHSHVEQVEVGMACESNRVDPFGDLRSGCGDMVDRARPMTSNKDATSLPKEGQGGQEQRHGNK